MLKAYNEIITKQENNNFMHYPSFSWTAVKQGKNKKIFQDRLNFSETVLYFESFY